MASLEKAIFLIALLVEKSRGKLKSNSKNCLICVCKTIQIIIRSYLRCITLTTISFSLVQEKIISCICQHKTSIS